MPKLKYQRKCKVQKTKFLILNFDIDLAFACLREAASAKAGILKFGLRKLTEPYPSSNPTLSFSQRL
jgi:hypothetical protein